MDEAILDPEINVFIRTAAGMGPTEFASYLSIPTQQVGKGHVSNWMSGYARISADTLLKYIAELAPTDDRRIMAVDILELRYGVRFTHQA